MGNLTGNTEIYDDKQKWLDRGGMLEHVGMERKKSNSKQYRKTKKISRQDKTIHIKWYILKQQKKNSTSK